MERIALYNDSFQNWKKYNIPVAQLILTDIPYQLGKDVYASSKELFADGKSIQSGKLKEKKPFFDTDTKEGFRLEEFFSFCSKLVKKEPKKVNDAGAMFLFCAFEQTNEIIETAKRYGFNHYQFFVFYKSSSVQCLKTNIKAVSNCEYGLLLYRDKLPKFNSDGKQFMTCRPYIKDTVTPRVHPTQKSVFVLEEIIRRYTSVNDVVIDLCAGSGTTVLACANLNRKCYGFEIKKEYVKAFYDKIIKCVNKDMFSNVEFANYKKEIEKKKNDKLI